VGFLPPGLLGAEPARRPLEGTRAQLRAGADVPLVAMLNSAYQSTYATLAAELMRHLGERGFRVSVEERRSEHMSQQSQALAAADLVLTRWIGDYPDPDTFMSLLHSETGLVGRLCGLPAVDRLVERGRRETEPDVRHEIYREIERLIAEHVLLLPLFHEQTCCFTRPEVEGCELGFFQRVITYDRLWVRQ
jgi:ABC-type oligopeptide transport system substrate-binding subunit